MTDVDLFGLRAGAHHMTNVVLHAAGTLLLFWVLQRMTGQTGRSALAAALFAIHPLHVESVAWIAERKDVLSGVFWMLTLWAYVSYVRDHRACQICRRRRFLCPRADVEADARHAAAGPAAARRVAARPDRPHAGLARGSHQPAGCREDSPDRAVDRREPRDVPGAVPRRRGPESGNGAHRRSAGERHGFLCQLHLHDRVAKSGSRPSILTGRSQDGGCSAAC